MLQPNWILKLKVIRKLFKTPKVVQYTSLTLLILILAILWVRKNPPEALVKFQFRSFDTSYYQYDTSLFVYKAVEYSTANSSAIVNEPDVTLATQLTTDRLERLSEIAVVWNGPVSAAVYVESESKLADEMLKLSEWHFRQPHCILNLVDMHVMIGNTAIPQELRGYPINSLRQLAQKHIRTQFVFSIDVDFLPSKGLRHNILTELSKQTFDPVTDLLVVPVFRLTSVGIHSLRVASIQSKRDLLKAKLQGQLEAYLDSGHRATDYEQWYQTTSGLYPITYEYTYEPYFVGAAQMLPEYSPYLVGPDADKWSFIYACNKYGFQWFGLSTGFMIHQEPSSRWHTWEHSAVTMWLDSRPVYTRNRYILQHYVMPEIETAPLKEIKVRRELFKWNLRTP